MVAVVEVVVQALGDGLAQDEGIRGAGPLPKTEAVLLRSDLRDFLCLRHPPAVLLFSAWTKLSTATLLASNKLWPNLAAAKEM